MSHTLILGLVLLTTCVPATPAVEPGDATTARNLVTAYMKWWGSSSAQRSAQPPACDDRPLSAEAAAAWRQAILKAWREVQAPAPQVSGRFPNWGSVTGLVRGVSISTFWKSPGASEPVTMRYGAVARGKQPASGWPVFLNLHSGGNDSQLNDESWAAAMLQHTVDGVLTVCPRSPVDTAESWYDPVSQEALEQLLVDLRLRWTIDPDRIYLYGYSMGGWGAFHLGPTLADRWAAVAASAGAGFVGATGRALPDNLRNTPMMIQIGTQDLAFGRYPRSKAFAEALQTLRVQDPAGYILTYKEHRNQGHQINDGDAPAWLLGHRRNPFPDRLVWQQVIYPPGVTIQDTPRLDDPEWFAQRLHFPHRHFWLRNDAPAPYQRVVAQRQDNSVRIVEARHLKQITLLLDSRMLNLDQPVTVQVGDARPTTHQVHRSLRVLLQTLVEHRDPTLMFEAELVVDLTGLPDPAAVEAIGTQALFARAQARWATGNLTGAEADLRAAAAIAPERAATDSLPLLLRLAIVRKDADSVVTVITRLTQAAGEVPTALARVAAMAAQVPAPLRPTALALDLARRASTASGRKDPDIEQVLAVAQFHSGDATTALATLDAALQLPAVQGNAFQQQRLQYYRHAIAKGSL